MEPILTNIFVTVVVSIFTVIATFFVSNFLRERSAYAKLREKLETIAGKNSIIVYGGSDLVGDNLFKITDFGKNGITIENVFQKIFIPSSKVLQMEFILPVDDYAERKEAYEKEQVERVSKAMFDPLMTQIKETFEKELESPGGDLNNSIKSQVIVILKEEGILVPTYNRKLIGDD